MLSKILIADQYFPEVQAYVATLAYSVKMANSNLGAAKKAKNDEFYTQYADIEKEMNAYLDFNQDVFKDKTILLPCDDPEWSNFTKYFAQNFQKLGLKKLISTSYAPDSKPSEINYQPTLFEFEDSKFDEVKTRKNGKIFTLDRDVNGDKKINVDDIQWHYLNGDGDFGSDEIRKLRDESDIVITNPPFSLFRQFFTWLIDGRKDFVIIGNMNAITYKEIFHQIKNNKVWIGATSTGSDMVFRVPQGYEISEDDRAKAAKLGYVGDFTRLGNSCWFTTLDHGRRHQPMKLMSMEDNLRYSKRMAKVGEYKKYDNYDAIEIGFSENIPSDFEGVMGVPISFIFKYNPDQFEILGCSYDYGRPAIWPPGTPMSPVVQGANVYKRIFIKHMKATK